MGSVWRDVWRLPKGWRVAVEIVSAVAPLSVTIIALISRKPASGPWPWWLNLSLGITLIWIPAYFFSKLSGLIWKPHKAFIETILNKLGEESWAKHGNKLAGPQPEHCITLFEAKKRNWVWRRFDPKWTHILVPRLRSPKSARVPRRKFRVHEHKRNYEGVAGLAFVRCHETIVTKPLPDLMKDKSEEAFKEYAKNAYDSIDRLKADPPTTTRMGAIAIWVGEYRWGVLVFDSCDREALEENTLKSVHCGRIVGLISRILESESL